MEIEGNNDFETNEGNRICRMVTNLMLKNKQEECLECQVFDCGNWVEGRAICSQWSKKVRFGRVPMCGVGGPCRARAVGYTELKPSRGL